MVAGSKETFEKSVIKSVGSPVRAIYINKMDEINIQKHVLVSEHVKLSEAEVKELLEKYNISLTQLPKILKNDAAIKNLDAKLGDVIKIKRNSPTAGEFNFYRLVIDGK